MEMIFFSLVPPNYSLVSVFDFLSCQLPSRAFNLFLWVASGTTEIQGHRQVCRARRGGPRAPSTTTDANLDGAFVENALDYVH